MSQMKLVALLPSARSGTALAHKEWGLAKLLAASPSVYLCFVPAALENLIFLTFFPYLLHLLSTSRTAERSIWNFAANSRTCTGAPSLAGTKPTGYLNVSASNSSKQMFILKVIFPCVTVTEIFPSQVPYLHSSI